MREPRWKRLGESSRPASHEDERRALWKALLLSSVLITALFGAWAIEVAVYVPEAILVLLIPMALLLAAFPTIAVMAWLRLRSAPGLL